MEQNKAQRMRPTPEQWQKATTAHTVMSIVARRSQTKTVQTQLLLEDGHTILVQTFGRHTERTDLGAAEVVKPLPTARELEIAAQIEVIEEKLNRRKNPLGWERRRMYQQQLRQLRAAA